MKDIEDRLKNIISANSKIAANEMVINEESDLIDDLGFDSLLMVQLIVDVEETFNFEFNYEELDMNVLRKYGNLKSYIITKIKS